MADPEAREVTQRALNTLRRVGAVGENDTIPEVSTAGDIDVTLNEFNKLVADKKSPRDLTCFELYCCYCW